MNKHRNVEFGYELPERTRSILVWIMAMMTGIDDDSASIVLFHGAFQLPQAFITAARNAGRHGDELVRMLIAALCKIPVRAFQGSGHFLPGFAETNIVHRIADHGPVQPSEPMGLKCILQRHRYRMLPPR